jgi:hypothetical protein
MHRTGNSGSGHNGGRVGARAGVLVGGRAKPVSQQPKDQAIDAAASLLALNDQKKKRVGPLRSPAGQAARASTAKNQRLKSPEQLPDSEDDDEGECGEEEGEEYEGNIHTLLMLLLF